MMTDTTRPSDEQLRETARRVRTRLVELAAATTVHLGPGMSVVDILAAAFAAHRRLSNLRVVVDRNGLQQSGPTRDILDLEPLDRKWESFGWRAVTVDGHDIPALMNAIEDGDPDRPSVTVARTVKGKGVEFMENDLRYHQLRLDAASHRRALAALADRQPVHAGQVGA